MDFLMIPGINNTSATFAPVIEAMPERHNCLSLDCPALDTVEDVAQALLADAPDRFVAVGHSFGGYVALAMLQLAPDRVQAVALVNSNDWADTGALAARREENAQKAEAGQFAALAEAASARAYHPDNHGRADLLAERAEGLKNYGAERYAAHQRASASRPDRGALLKDSGKPVLIVAADHDVVIPTDRQTDMAERLDARLTLIETAGHMLPAEQPAALASALAAWADSDLNQGHLT